MGVWETRGKFAGYEHTAESTWKYCKDGESRRCISPAGRQRLEELRKQVHPKEHIKFVAKKLVHGVWVETDIPEIVQQAIREKYAYLDLSEEEKEKYHECRPKIKPEQRDTTSIDIKPYVEPIKPQLQADQCEKGCPFCEDENGCGGCDGEQEVEQEGMTLNDLAGMMGMGKVSVLSGVGPDAPMVENEKGGRQSLVKGRYDLLPPLALMSVARVLEEGATKYGVDNWKQIDARSHVNHIIQHLLAWLASDTQDEHLSHSACRALMALEVDILEETKHGNP